MSETRTTALFALVAVLAAWAAAPRTAVRETFEEHGAPFFPEFRDPNAATSLEVVEFDARSSVGRAFKVVNRNGRWTIPSHYDYPADGATRLPRIAAAMIAIKKDDIASENVADHEKTGVIDPLDDTALSPTARGTRVTVRGQNDKVLADIILGSKVEGRVQLRYVRLPDQRRVYIADVGELPVSTRFEDWIERDLLQVNRYDIDRIAIRRFVFNETRDRMTGGEGLALTRTDRDVWRLDGSSAGKELFRVNLLVTRLDDLTIAGVEPKPPTVAALTGQPVSTRLSSADADDLAAKGFYLTKEGALLGAGGDVLVHTDSGIEFLLQFGDVVRRPTAADEPAAATANASSVEASRYR